MARPGRPRRSSAPRPQPGAGRHRGVGVEGGLLPRPGSDLGTRAHSRGAGRRCGLRLRDRRRRRRHRPRRAACRRTGAPTGARRRMRQHRRSHLGRLRAPRLRARTGRRRRLDAGAAAGARHHRRRRGGRSGDQRRRGRPQRDRPGDRRDQGERRAVCPYSRRRTCGRHAARLERLHDGRRRPDRAARGPLHGAHTARSPRRRVTTARGGPGEPHRAVDRVGLRGQPLRGRRPAARGRALRSGCEPSRGLRHHDHPGGPGDDARRAAAQGPRGRLTADPGARQARRPPPP